MKIKMRRAAPSEVGSIQRALDRCKRLDIMYCGVPYDDPLMGEDGILLVLYAPHGTSKEVCISALKKGYSERDVIDHVTVFCPPKWFSELGIEVPGRPDPALPLAEPEV